VSATEIFMGVPDDQRYNLVEILLEGLGSKYIPLFGSEIKCLNLFSQNIRSDRVITAINAGTVVGVACLHYDGSECFNSPFRALWDELSLGVIRFLFLSWIMSESVESDTMYLDSLAVRSSQRGQGLGTKIINKVFSLAQEKGLTKVKLHVIDRNHNAKRLYERLDFKITGEKSLFYPLTTVFNFKKAYEMTRIL